MFESRETAIVGLSCGGQADAVIAQYVAKNAEFLDAPIYAEWNIGNCLSDDKTKYLRYQAPRPDRDRRIDTRTILEIICGIAIEDARPFITLVTHEIHMRRALLTTEKIRGVLIVVPVSVRTPLDPLSNYPWVRSARLFRFHERHIAMPYYQLRGWV